jgi:hypothetical protein
MDCFTEWLRYPEGVENISKWARNYILVYLHFFDGIPEGIKFCQRIRRIISESNLFLLDNMKELSEIFNSYPFQEDIHLLESYKERIKTKHHYYKNEIINTMAKLLSFVEDQKIKTYT